MGPHSFECGNCRQQGLGWHWDQASMGPHSFECGNVPCTKRGTKSSVLSFNGAALVRVRKLVSVAG